MKPSSSGIMLLGALCIVAVQLAWIQAKMSSDWIHVKNGCDNLDDIYTLCLTENGIRPVATLTESHHPDRTMRYRWIIFKYNTTDLPKYVQHVETQLNYDNKKFPPVDSNRTSQIRMEFEFKSSKVLKAVSFDATEDTFLRLESELDTSQKREFGVKAPVFIHADYKMGGNGDVIKDNVNHPPGFKDARKQPHTYKMVTYKDSKVKAKYKELEEDDWAVRTMINHEGQYKKKVPKIPLRREYTTHVYVIGEGIDAQAHKAIDLEDVKILNGYKVKPTRFAEIKMSDQPVGNLASGIGNLATYQAQVIGSFNKHNTIIPIAIAGQGQHTADYILRAFEAIFELKNKSESDTRTLVTFSGKVFDSAKYDSFRFTEFIGRILEENGITMTYGMDEEAESLNVETFGDYTMDPKDFTQYMHIGWYPYVLSVMAVGKDLAPTKNQIAIFERYQEFEGIRMAFAPGAVVYIPYLFDHDVFRYIGKYEYVDSSIAAAMAVSLVSFYRSSSAMRYIESPKETIQIVIKQSYNKVSNFTFLTLVSDFCSVVDSYVYDPILGSHKCIHRRLESFVKEPKFFS